MSANLAGNHCVRLCSFLVKKFGPNHLVPPERECPRCICVYLCPSVANGRVPPPHPACGHLPPETGGREIYYANDYPGQAFLACRLGPPALGWYLSGLQPETLSCPNLCFICVHLWLRLARTLAPPAVISISKCQVAMWPRPTRTVSRSAWSAVLQHRFWMKLKPFN